MAPHNIEHIPMDVNYLCPVCSRPTTYKYEEDGDTRTYQRYCTTHMSACGWEGFAGEETRCEKCDGEGRIECSSPDTDMGHLEECADCDGRGWILEED